MTRTNTNFPSNVKTWISALANLSSSCGAGTVSSFFFNENILFGGLMRLIPSEK